jgi:hypothetical protein
MAKRVPALTPEERARIRRQASEATRSIRMAAEAAATREAQAWLVAHGALVPGEGVRDCLRRLDGYRRALLQTSAPSYRPTVRQLQAVPLPGIVEIEF